MLNPCPLPNSSLDRNHLVWTTPQHSDSLHLKPAHLCRAGLLPRFCLIQLCVSHRTKLTAFLQMGYQWMDVLSLCVLPFQLDYKLLECHFFPVHPVSLLLLGQREMLTVLGWPVIAVPTTSSLSLYLFYHFTHSCNSLSPPHAPLISLKCFFYVQVKQNIFLKSGRKIIPLLRFLFWCRWHLWAVDTVHSPLSCCAGIRRGLSFGYL